MKEGKTSGNCFGGPAKYKQILLKVQEYPVNLALMELAERDISAPGTSVMESRGEVYNARPTENKAIRLAELRERVNAVEQALLVVPEEYRAGVLYHTLNHGSRSVGVGNGSAWSDPRYSFAHRNTWKKWKTRFLLEYATIIGERDYIDLLREYGDELAVRSRQHEIKYSI